MPAVRRSLHRYGAFFFKKKIDFNRRFPSTVTEMSPFIWLRVDWMGERGRKGAGSAQEAPATDVWPGRAAPQPAGYPRTAPGGRTAGESPPPGSSSKVVTL